MEHPGRNLAERQPWLGPLNGEHQTRFQDAIIENLKLSLKLSAL